MFLTLRDFYSTIQDQSLQQIISNDDSFRIQKMRAAISEASSYIEQKYNVAGIFRDTVKFSFTSTYSAGQLVYLDGDAYNPALTYSQNTITLYQASVYYCSTPIVSPEAFNLAHWTLLGSQYDYFYVSLPFLPFDSSALYFKGYNTFYKDKVYPAIADSTVLTHEEKIQYNNQSDFPPQNVAPDAIGQSQWGTGVPFSISGLWPTAKAADFSAWSNVTSYTTGSRVSNSGVIFQAQKNNLNVTPGTDITSWLPISYTSGDNRNQRMVECITHITLYRLSTRISPRNVPDVWVKNYDDEISWLKRCAKGEVTLDADLIQPRQGGRIRFGGSPDKITSY